MLYLQNAHINKKRVVQNSKFLRGTGFLKCRLKDGVNGLLNVFQGLLLRPEIDSGAHFHNDFGIDVERIIRFGRNQTL